MSAKETLRGIRQQGLSPELNADGEAVLYRNRTTGEFAASGDIPGADREEVGPREFMRLVLDAQNERFVERMRDFLQGTGRARFGDGVDWSTKTRQERRNMLMTHLVQRATRPGRQG